MLDLKKYEKKAHADPDFKKRLLRNANQAIREEFGVDLPYKLNCREKLTFEVETTDDSLSENNFESVAGGSPPHSLVPFNLKMFSDKYICKYCLPDTTPGSTGFINYTGFVKQSSHPLALQRKWGRTHDRKLIRGQDGVVYMVV